ncbi:MAG: amidase, partial [Alphaproteobacteria bacterium]|nr:amidase [Alphaproteobacteria bacterium]
MNPYATARELLKALETRKLFARELLDFEIARNDQLSSSLNAVVATDVERARRDADAMDVRRKTETLPGRLAGLPMTIKDGLDVENMPATSGNPAFVNRRRDCADAAMVRLARNAGAIIWGKTNVPLMLGDFQSYNEIYGTTNNPYDLSRTPGGSSGGAAAALASGITALEIGSDIGGSLRHPANFCGVCALKPTWGVLDLHGHVPPVPGAFFETDLGVVGPMARNTDDLKLLWSVLSQTEEAPRREIKASRIAIWDEAEGFPLAAEVREAVARAAEALSGAGAHVARAKPGIDTGALMENYTSLLVAVLSIGLPEDLFRSFEAMRESDRKAVEAEGERAAAARYRLRATASYRDVMGAAIRRTAMKDRLAAFF